MQIVFRTEPEEAAPYSAELVRQSEKATTISTQPLEVGCLGNQISQRLSGVGVWTEECLKAGDARWFAMAN